MTIKAMEPHQVQAIQNFISVDNLFRSLITDEEKHKANMNGLKHIMKKLRSKNVMTVQIANGLFEDVTPSKRKELIDNTNKNFQAANDAYQGVIEQCKHRADEVGESRIRVFKIMANLLQKQHGLNVDDLTCYLVERPVDEKRPDVALDDDIKKAIEVAKNG